MTKTVLKYVLGAIVLAAAVLGVVFWDNIQGALTGLKSPPADISDVIDGQGNPDDPDETGDGAGEGQTGYSLSLPDGFRIEVMARDLPGARVLAQDGLGNFWVSQTSEGMVSLLETEDGRVTNIIPVFRGLNRPHGLAVDPGNGTMLYIAEEHRISRVPLYTEAGLERIVDLPTEGGGHSTRTVAFGPDDRLYVSIGSSCNACDESDPRRAAIYSMNRDGSDFRPYATGLRNAVFFDWSQVDGRMWATDNGRDLLGDNIPPDEINIIREGGNYGWPLCYGRNIHDTDFDRRTYVQNPCREPHAVPAHVEIPAHSAPLGLGFVPEEGWPEEYWYDLIVALHGSWNRTEPTGYKLIRVKLDADGNYQGTEDFITGWLTPDGALGRPVGVLIRPGGLMFVTDDKAGVVYRITRDLEE